MLVTSCQMVVLMTAPLHALHWLENAFQHFAACNNKTVVISGCS